MDKVVLILNFLGSLFTLVNSLLDYVDKLENKNTKN